MYLTFDGAFNYTGNSRTGSYIPFSKGTPITLKEIPVDAEYIIEENNGTNYSWTCDVPLVALVEGVNVEVTVTNTFDEGDSQLSIQKVLGDNHEAWGVNENTVFRAVLYDVTNRNYLLFPTGREGNTYRANGNSGIDDPLTGHIIEFTAGQPVTIVGLWEKNNPSDLDYIVYELVELMPAGANYTPTYTDNNITLPSGASKTISVRNDYEPGNGSLVINKALAGSFTDWGVNSATLFQTRIKVAGSDPAVYLVFDGEYNYTGVTSATGSYITFSRGAGVTLTGLPTGMNYEIEETSGTHYKWSCTPSSTVRLEEDGENKTVTVTNTYEPGTNTLIIQKTFAGSWTDWGVNENTVFRAVVYDITAGNYLKFPEGRNDNTYNANGNSGINDPLTGDVIEFTVGQPVTITGLWEKVPGTDTYIEYAVVELVPAGAKYTPHYTGNNFTLPQGETKTVTVTNRYIPGEGELTINKTLAGSFNDQTAQ